MHNSFRFALFLPTHPMPSQRPLTASPTAVNGIAKDALRQVHQRAFPIITTRGGFDYTSNSKQPMFSITATQNACIDYIFPSRPLFLSPANTTNICFPHMSLWQVINRTHLFYYLQNNTINMIGHSLKSYIHAKATIVIIHKRINDYSRRQCVFFVIFVKNKPRLP